MIKKIAIHICLATLILTSYLHATESLFTKPRTALDDYEQYLTDKEKDFQGIDGIISINREAGIHTIESIQKMDPAARAAQALAIGKKDLALMLQKDLSPTDIVVTAYLSTPSSAYNILMPLAALTDIKEGKTCSIITGEQKQLVRCAQQLPPHQRIAGVSYPAATFEGTLKDILQDFTTRQPAAQQLSEKKS